MKTMHSRFGPLEVIPESWRAVNWGMQKAQFSVGDQRGMILDELRLIQYGNGRRWIGLPQRQADPTKGENKPVNLIRFDSDEAYNDFLREVLEAVDRFLLDTGHGL